MSTKNFVSNGDAETLFTGIGNKLSTLKSGLTNLDNEVNGDATTYPYADVITIEDAVPSNLADCNVKIEPVQDLHGYDKPWVGGAGKNKAYVNINSGETALTEIKDNDNNVIGVNADVGAAGVVVTVKMATVSIENGKTYTLSGSPNDKGNSTYRLDVRTQAQGQLYNNWNEIDNPTITATEDVTLDIYLRIAANYAVNNLVFRPQIEEGSTPTTFAPYTNICPITGHTEASVQRDGKNLCPIAKMNTLNSDTFKLNAGTYTMSFKMAGSGMYSTSSVILRDDSNANVLSVGVGSASSGTVKKGQFTLQSEKTLHLYVNNITASTGGYYIEDIQIELGQTDTSYEPYAGKTYTIALGDTIYGGTVDFDSGVMTVDRAIVTFDGSNDEGWNSYDSSKRVGSYYIATTVVKTTSASDLIGILCDQFKEVTPNETYAGNIGISGDGDGRLLVADGTKAMTASDWKTYLASNPMQVVYPLRSPVTIQLTPQQIQLLKGTNTLTASTGQISVTVNGVSGAIGAVQEQVNELAEEVADTQSELTNLGSFDTSERLVGKYGQSNFYRKEYDVGMLPNNSSITVQIDFFNQPVIITGYAEKNGYTIPLPYLSASGGIVNIRTQNYGRELVITSTADFSAYHGHIIMYYVKQ